ncbi:MAG TPA: allophanate hydrolase [Acidisoma sp.]|nr:allophanate hydrolase [Acidisoma sp.]
MSEFSFDIASLRAAYLSGSRAPSDVMAEALRRLARSDDQAIWISRLSNAELMAAAEALDARRDEIERLPLYGIPFAIKDNIDLAGLPTTAACPAFAYDPPHSARAVEKLVAAGAIPVGKTNLDQFATGLVGVRSPYGIPRNSFDPKMVPGGSSSGSAVAVALGLVSFALGTDTAGSGRVPAAFNNLVGIKPTRGLISNGGMVPACRSLDCISIFSLTVPDALAVLKTAGGFDASDAYSRPAPAGFSVRLRNAPGRFTFAVPRAADLQFFGDDQARSLFGEAVTRAESLGGEAIEIDFARWVETANLLYGPWSAERAAAVGSLLTAKPEALHPVTRQIVGVGLAPSAIDLFRAQYRLQELAQAIRPIWETADFLLVPTTGTAFSLADLEAEPIARNTDLGYYTNFTNLLDLSAIAVPGGFKADGFPVGITLIGPAWHDAKLAGFAHAMHRAMAAPLGATGIAQSDEPEPAAGIISQPEIEIAVFGAHLSGQALNPQLKGLGGRLQRLCRTAGRYRMVAIPGRILRPGLIDIGPGGHAIDGEIWSLPTASLAAFLATITPPLGLGQVRLDGGEIATGFICEGGVLTEDATDVSAFGFWPAYLQSLSS